MASPMIKTFSVSGFKNGTIKDILQQLSRECKVCVRRLSQKEIDFHTRRKPVVESDSRPVVSHTAPTNSELGVIANNINEISNLTENKLVKEKRKKSVIRSKPCEKKQTGGVSKPKVDDFIQISNVLNKMIETVGKQIDSTKRKRKKPVKHNEVKTKIIRKEVDIIQHDLSRNSQTVSQNTVLNSVTNKCIEDSYSSTKSSVTPSSNSVHVVITPPEERFQPASNAQLSTTNSSVIPQYVEKIHTLPVLQNEVNINRSQNVNPEVSNVSSSTSSSSSSSSLHNNTCGKVSENKNLFNTLVSLIQIHFNVDVCRKVAIMKDIYIRVFNEMLRYKAIRNAISKSSSPSEEKNKKIKICEHSLNVVMTCYCKDFAKLFNDIVQTFGINIRYELMLILYCKVICLVCKDSGNTATHFFIGKQVFMYILRKVKYSPELLFQLFNLEEVTFCNLVLVCCKAISSVHPWLPPGSELLLDTSKEHFNKVNQELVGFNTVADENLNQQNVVIKDPHIDYAGSNTNNSNNSADLNISIQLRHSLTNNQGSPCCTVTSNKSCEVNNCFSVGRCCCVNENKRINENIASYNKNQNVVDFNNTNYNLPLPASQLPLPPPYPTNQTGSQLPLPPLFPGNQTYLPQLPVKEVSGSGMNYFHQATPGMLKNSLNQYYQPSSSLLKSMLHSSSNKQGLMYPQHGSTSPQFIPVTENTYVPPGFPKQVSVPPSTQMNHHNAMIPDKNRNTLNSSQQIDPMPNYNSKPSQNSIPVNQNIPESSHVQSFRQSNYHVQNHTEFYPKSNFTNATNVNSTVTMNKDNKHHLQEQNESVLTKRVQGNQVQTLSSQHKDGIITEFVKNMNYDKLHEISNERLTKIVKDNQRRPRSVQGRGKVSKKMITVPEIASKVNQGGPENVQKSRGKVIGHNESYGSLNDNNTSNTTIQSTNWFPPSYNTNTLNCENNVKISQLSPSQSSTSEKQSVQNLNFKSGCRLKVKDPKTLNGSIVEVNPKSQNNVTGIRGVYIIESNEVETSDESVNDPLAIDDDVSLIGNNSESSVQKNSVSNLEKNSSTVSGNINNSVSSVQQHSVSNLGVNSSAIIGDNRAIHYYNPLVSNTRSHMIQPAIQNSNVLVSSTGPLIGSNSLSVTPVKRGANCWSNEDNSRKSSEFIHKNHDLATITPVPLRSPQVSDQSVPEKDVSSLIHVTSVHSKYTCSAPFTTTPISSASVSRIGNLSSDEERRRIIITSSGKGNSPGLNAVSTTECTISSNLTQANNKTDIGDNLRCSFENCEKEATVLCSGCHQMQYCNQDCQEKHWYAGHMNLCKSADQLS